MDEMTNTEQTTQLTQEQAIELYNSGVYKDWTHEQIVRFQLFQNLLCVPFAKFHEAIESVLGRSVWTHEFANKESIIKEYLGVKDPPTMEEIINMIPEEKRLLVGL